MNNHLQRTVYLVPEELELFGQLRVNRLLSAAAGTLELRLGKVLGERGLIPALERNDAQLAHLLKTDLGEHIAEKSTDNGRYCIADGLTPQLSIAALQSFQPFSLLFLLPTT